MKNVALIAVLLAAGILRFLFLGYSDYQGDETKALYNPKEDKSLQFFLEQRKGPAQFIVTAALKPLTQEYRNRFLLRLPFALAGFGSALVFYLVVKQLINTSVALYSTVFFATNGFLVAFSRIVQYQSLVIFFGLLSIYLVLRYRSKNSLGYLLGAGISLALSILSHYDGVFFIPVIAGILLEKILRTEKTLRIVLFKHLSLSVLLFLLFTCSFYVPFVLNIAKSTTNYWAGRISGEVSGKISSSVYLFKVYQPIYAFYIYAILAGFGLLFAFSLAGQKIFKLDIHHIGTAHRGYSLVSILSLLTWFLLPFVLMEVVISIPGTHIYSYLIPLFVFMGIGAFHFERSVAKINQLSFYVFRVFFAVMSVFLFVQSFMVFVDHTSAEYPWQNKQFFAWTFSKPSATYHLSLFGFPYYRHWQDVADLLNADNRSEFYSTNERDTISEYYLDQKKDSKKMGYYIYIHNPQKMIAGLNNKRVIRYAYDNNPLAVYKNWGNVVTEVYLLPVNSPSISKEEFAKYGIKGDEE